MRSRGLLLIVLCLLATLGALRPAPAAAGPLGDSRWAFSDRYPVEIPVLGADDARRVVDTGIDVEGVDLLGGPELPGRVRANVNEAEEANLVALGWQVIPLHNLSKEMGERVRQYWRETGALEGTNIPDKDVRYDNWYTVTQLGADLAAVEAAYPNLVHVISIGNSVQGRPIWFVKISDNVSIEENEPEFKFSSSLHGDEVTGMELCRRMIHYLTDNYGVDATVTNLVNGAELWFCPMTNPDGYTNNTRYNAQGFDLNRNFPDPVTDPNDDPTGRPQEVQLYMNFATPHNFILGANYHGGALVFNMPWDCTYDDPADNILLWYIGEGYAYRNPPMWNSTEFTHGVVNGADWYVIHGGLQDWSYNWRGEIHNTIEVSTTKWPAWTLMDQFWSENRDAMLWYMQQTITTGVQGTVTDAVTGQPLSATVNLAQINWPIKSDPDLGDYHRITRPGTYTVTYEKSGYQLQTLPNVVVVDGSMTVRDVQLQPSATYALSGTVRSAQTLAPLGATIEVRRHDNGTLVGTTQSNPTTGTYSINLASAIYDVRALACGFVPQTQTVTLTSSIVLDFALQPAANLVLVVNDGATDRVANDLTTIGYSVVSEAASSTSLSSWSCYSVVIWTSGANEAPVANAGYRSMIESFVAGGGKLLIEGGELGYDAAASPGYPTFKTNVLHITSWNRDNGGALNLYAPSHALATTPNALPSSYAITYVNYGDEDAVVPASGATAVYRSTLPSTPVCAGVLAYDDDPGTPATGQIVYLPFCYNGLVDQAAARLLLQNALTYLGAAGGESDAPDFAPDADRLALAPISPNPWRPMAGGIQVGFQLPASDAARLGVYDVLGREVRSLTTSGRELPPGWQQIAWDGRNNAGARVPAGTYWIRLESAGQEITRPVTLVR